MSSFDPTQPQSTGTGLALWVARMPEPSGGPDDMVVEVHHVVGFGEDREPILFFGGQWVPASSVVAEGCAAVVSTPSSPVPTMEQLYTLCRTGSSTRWVRAEDM